MPLSDMLNILESFLHYNGPSLIVDYMVIVDI